jgi:HD-GYP domain-containing protein (c-di-GMP phosphodiesterase class II)
VADAYEALTSRRPHRPALPREAAIAELRKNSGSQFAPQVVEAFVAATARPVPAAASAQAALLRHLSAEQA